MMDDANTQKDYIQFGFFPSILGYIDSGIHINT